MKDLPLFPVTMVGSWPRPPALLREFRKFQRGDLSLESFRQEEDSAILDLLRLQEAVGLDVVTDGELRRDNFYSFVAGKLDGVRLMSLAEMLEIVEDRAGFERLLQTLDVPAFSIRNPTCVGKIRRREALALDDYLFLRRHTDLAIKVPLPGPYLLTRAMWVKEVTRGIYATKEDLAEDVVAILSDEIKELQEAGADFIQLDEPVLSEVAFSPAGVRTFMCAALAARADPSEELEWAVSLINRVAASVTTSRLGLHICRGNWSRDESTLLSGSYSPLRPYLERLNVRQLVLEFATPRAGELAALLGAGSSLDSKELGLGLVNPRTTEVESVDEITGRVHEALQYLPPDRIFLNPDCGFGTFTSRPMNTAAVARRKMEALVEAAGLLREQVQG